MPSFSSLSFDDLHLATLRDTEICSSMTSKRSLPVSKSTAPNSPNSPSTAYLYSNQRKRTTPRSL